VATVRRCLAALILTAFVLARPSIPALAAPAAGDHAAQIGELVDHVPTTEQPGDTSEPARPSSLPRPGEETGPSNPGGFIALGLLLVGWAGGFTLVLRRARRSTRDRAQQPNQT
jgi:hypothetical protein